jgi:predicted nucleotidyltransferase
MTDLDELYVMARRVLLDALEALADHRDAIVLVGAQAVYLRTGEADLAVAPFTTDGDLAIDPAVLAETPPLERALMAAGFSAQAPGQSVGIWITKRSTSRDVSVDIAVDLLVPAAVSPGKGRRAAKLPGHDTRSARIVQGLEGALIDADVLTLAALEAIDMRVLDVRVAGPAALLIAKLHKINDRRGESRQSDKDALDVVRLLNTATDDLARRYTALLADPRSVDAARRGRTLLEAQFASPKGLGVEMAIRSAGPLADADQLEASCVALTSDLLAELDR